MRNPLVPWALVALAACSDEWIPPSLLDDHDPGPTLFPTGSEEEQRLAEEIAYAHLEEHEVRLLAGIEGLATRGVVIRDGAAHVRIDQTVDGLPVFGAQAIVHVGPDGEVTELTDGWQHGVAVPTVPDLFESDAVDLAVAASGGWDSVTAWPDSVLGVLAQGDTATLTWRVRVPRLDGTSATSIPVVFVDGLDGSVVFAYDDLQTATCSATTSYNGSISFPCDTASGGYRLVSASSGGGTFTIRNAEPWTVSASDLYDVTSASTRWTTELSSVDAQYGVLATLDYYRAVHGRNGIDGSGGPKLKDGVATAVVHYGRDYGNAYWDGSAMVFGDGDGYWLGPATALDITAHELTHGVTEHSANLTYYGESGALNESVSDVFGAVVEHRNSGAGPHVWLIGEDAWTPGTSGDALRYMDDPMKDGESPDHYSARYTGSADNGGVHTNSGIPNLAFALMADGGKHPRRASVCETQGIGVETAGKIWYQALTQWMTPSTDLHGARTATISAAGALHGADSDEAYAVACAWAEVGVGTAPGAPTDPEPEPEPDPGTGGDGLDLTGLSAAKDASLTYTFDVPAGATNLEVRITGGTGDADLYVRAGSAPTDTAYDCRPYLSGNDEKCTFAAPATGTWHVRVKAWSAFSGVALTAAFTPPSEAPPPAEEGDRVDETALSDAKDGEKRWTITVPAGSTKAEVKMSGGTGDADLYVRQNADPTTLLYDCRPYKYGNDETCTIANPQAGTLHVMIHAYSAYSGLSLEAWTE